MLELIIKNSDFQEVIWRYELTTLQTLTTL